MRSVRFHARLEEEGRHGLALIVRKAGLELRQKGIAAFLADNFIAQPGVAEHGVRDRIIKAFDLGSSDDGLPGRRSRRLGENDRKAQRRRLQAFEIQVGIDRLFIRVRRHGLAFRGSRVRRARRFRTKLVRFGPEKPSAVGSASECDRI